MDNIFDLNSISVDFDLMERANPVFNTAKMTLFQLSASGNEYAAAIAEKLGLPQITYAGEIKKEGKTLTVKRILEDGYMMISVQTPCMITCIKELNTPRYMSVSGVLEAFEKEIEIFDYPRLKDHPLIDATTIGLKGSPTNIYKSFTPPQKGVGMMLKGDGKETTNELAAILAGKHII